MSFENINRVTDKNAGNQRQNNASKDFTRKRMERMLENAEKGPSSTSNKRVESLKALQGRGGNTAPGSEILLTGEGLLGGSSSSQGGGRRNSIENMTNELRKDPKFDAEIRKQARELAEQEKEKERAEKVRIALKQEQEKKINQMNQQKK